jgi:hypothetical protein
MINSLTAAHHRIIVAPLNWGLGHATRCIPIINALLDAGKEVVLASDGEALELLREEFPALVTEPLPGYDVTYKGEHLVSLVLPNMPRVLKAIIQENSSARKLTEKYQPDLIISDSRFGFRSKTIKSVIISHQLQLMSPSPLLGVFLNFVNTQLLNAFDACWIPDDQANALAGALTQNPRIKNQKHLGILSRLSPDIEIDKQYEVAILLSGPEPARTKLEKKLIEKFSTSKESICLVRGTTKQASLSLPTNWTVIDRANSRRINEILLGSQRIISRSGYTSLMDYRVLGVGAELIPTAGQTEQEYLAKYVDGRYGFSLWGESE